MGNKILNGNKIIVLSVILERRFVMTYGEYKQTEEYLNAEDIDLCINGV